MCRSRRRAGGFATSHFVSETPLNATSEGATTADGTAGVPPLRGSSWARGPTSPSSFSDRPAAPQPDGPRRWRHRRRQARRHLSTRVRARALNSPSRKVTCAITRRHGSALPLCSHSACIPADLCVARVGVQDSRPPPPRLTPLAKLRSVTVCAELHRHHHTPANSSSRAEKAPRRRPARRVCHHVCPR